MNSIDTLFHEFLCYLSKWRAGEQPDIKQYYKQKPYEHLWRRFHNWFLDGICPPSMQAYLEHEKWKLLSNGLTDDEVLEVILLEKLMYSFYTGDDEQIGQLTQNFTSRQLQLKHARLLEKLGKSIDIDPSYTHKTVHLLAEINTDTPPENSKEDHLQECFLSIRREVDFLLELKKIELIRRMLQEEMPEEAIKKLTDIDNQYLDTVSRFLDDTDIRIYQELFQNGCVTLNFANKIDYDQLDFFESQILQILQFHLEAE